MSSPPASTTLRKEIKDKQNEISDYLSYLEPFGTRLTYITIIGGAAAALLNGELARTLSQGTSSSTSWLIALGASLSSLAATVAAGIHKSQVESRLSKLQKCAAKMEGLAALLDAHQLTDQVAATRYDKYLEECPSIPRQQKLAFEAVRGTITEPHENQEVQASFTASGTAQSVGRNVYLWLTVEIDDRIWPKEGRIIVDSDGQWSQPVFEDVKNGAPEEFGLSLWAVNAEANRKLGNWLDEGNRTRTFPPLRPLPGMRRLARVKVLRHNG